MFRAQHMMLVVRWTLYVVRSSDADAAVDNVTTPSAAGLHHANTSSLAIVQPRLVPDRSAGIRSM